MINDLFNLNITENNKKIIININTDTLDFLPSHITHLRFSNKHNIFLEKINLPNLEYLELGSYTKIYNLEHLKKLRTVNLWNNNNCEYIKFSLSVENIIIFNHDNKIIDNLPYGIKNLYICVDKFDKKKYYNNLPFSLEKIFLNVSFVYEVFIGKKDIYNEIKNHFKLPFGCVIEFVENIPKFILN